MKIENDIEAAANSGAEAFRALTEKLRNDSQIERSSHQSINKMAELAERQYELLKEINIIANKAINQADIAENNANIARRHAIWANLIALLSIIVSIALAVKSI